MSSSDIIQERRLLWKNDAYDRSGIVKRYLIEETEPYIPISLDKLIDGHAVPFEVFTDDGDLKKSLFDRGFIFNVFAKEIIHHQGLTTILYQNRQ